MKPTPEHEDAPQNVGTAGGSAPWLFCLQHFCFCFQIAVLQHCFIYFTPQNPQFFDLGNVVDFPLVTCFCVAMQCGNLALSWVIVLQCVKLLFFTTKEKPK